MNGNDNVKKAALLPLFTRMIFGGDLKRQGDKYKASFHGADKLTPTNIQKFRKSLIDMNSLLQKTSIMNGDFSHATAKAKFGDFIYMDPPYFYEKGDTNMMIYNTAHESEYDQWCRIRNDTERLTSIGVLAMITSSAHERIRRLFGGYRMTDIRRNRCISTNDRSPTTDIIITNY